MITFRQKGSFKNSISFLRKTKNGVNRRLISIAERYGKLGVQALASATPVETGLTANSWRYEIEIANESLTITFYNTNIQNGIPVAILIQYGHGTRNGGWVEGRDFINPAIQPIFDNMAKDAWREVTD